MTTAENRRRTVVVGTNPRTGSPIKVRKHNKSKSKSGTAVTGPSIAKSPLSRMKSALTKRKVKAGRPEESSLMCNGVPISLSELSTPPNVAGQPMDSASLSQGPAVPNDQLGTIVLPDSGDFHENMTVEADSDTHHAAWLQQLPKFDGSQRHRRMHAWPRWRDTVLKTVVPLFLQAEAMIFNRVSLPKPESPTPSQLSPTCVVAECSQTLTSTLVQCIERTVIYDYNVQHCPSLNCASSLAAILVKCGFFPCTPSKCKTAFSFEILESYLAMSVQSSFSPTIFRTALLHGLQQRQYESLGLDPWKNQLPEAILWFDAMKRLIEVRFSQLVKNAEQNLLRSHESPISLGPNDQVAAYILRKRCSWCFGRRTWGGDPEINPDVIVCIDACFQHRRYSSIPDDPEILQQNDAFIFLTEEQLWAAQQHCMERRNNNKASTRQDARVPSGSLDDCRDSHNAATNKGDNQSNNLYASKANMNVVCRHDKPLFACDVRTPGEQQFYAIALIQALAECLPPTATIGILYDIACQLDRSIAKHDFIPDIAPRLSCATALFHAYAHQISCQWVYHPRRRTGFGWTNGEGNERNWALARDTISQERIMGPHRRLFFLARKYEYIAMMKNARGGDWMDRKWNDIKKAKIEAETYLTALRPMWTTERLREEYIIQQRTQLSVRAYNAQVASRNLTTLIDTQRSASSLTSALDILNKELDNYEYQQRMLGADCRDVRHLYEAANELQRHHQESIEQLQELTANLGLLQSPLPSDVEEQDKPFLKQMILIHTMKTAIWTRLQRLQDEMTPVRESATRSGVGSSLGTKRLQSVVRTIQGRSKSINTAVDTYNKLIEELPSLRMPSWFNSQNIPERLEKKGLADIGPEAELWEDIAMSHVWFTLFGGQFESAPAYIRDPSVRKGVQMMLQLDRIVEEEGRLRLEHENMLSDFTLEFLALHFAIQHPVSQELAFRLERRMVWLLRHRHCFIKGKHRPNIALWRLQPNDVMAFVHDNVDISPLLQSVYAFQCRHASYVRDASLCEPEPGRSMTSANVNENFALADCFNIFDDESTPMTCVVDSSGTVDNGATASTDSDNNSSNEQDDLDDPEATASADVVELTNDIRSLSVRNEEPQIHIALPGDLQASVTNNDARQQYRQRRPNSLPSIHTLFEVLQADQHGTTPQVLLENTYSRACTAVARSMMRTTAPRVEIDDVDRFCDDFSVGSEDLRCLNAHRHLKMTVVAAYCRLLIKHYKEHALAAFIPAEHRPNLWIIDPGCLDVGVEVMLYHFIADDGTVRHDRFTKSAWLFPWYSSVRDTWMLGVVDWKRRKFWYCDSRPLCVRDVLREGDACMWQRLRRFTAIACALVRISEDVFAWGLGRSCLRDRLVRKTDSGLWVLADIEAWHTGALHADSNTDMDAYRRVVRQAILSLPPLPDNDDWCWNRPTGSTKYITWREKLRQVLRERPWTNISLPRSYKRSQDNPLLLDSLPEPEPLRIL